MELLLRAVDHLQQWVHQSISPAIQGGYPQRSEEDFFHRLVEEAEASKIEKTYMYYNMLKSCINNTLVNIVSNLHCDVYINHLPQWKNVN